MHPIISNILTGFGEIFKSPFKEISIWWFLIPILVLWIIIELYFGKHKSEKLGWNTALGNGITLVWINVESMRYLFENHPDPFWLRFIIVILILLYGVFIIYISFTHKLSDKATYRLADPTPIYFFSTISVLWGHGVLILTWWVLLDLIILYLLVYVMFLIFRKVIPSAVKEDSLGESPEKDSLEDIKF